MPQPAPDSKSTAEPAPTGKTPGSKSAAPTGAGKDAERERRIERATSAALAPTAREVKRRLTRTMLSMLALVLCVAMAVVIAVLDVTELARFDAAPIDLDLRTATPATMPADYTRVRLINADLVLHEMMPVRQNDDGTTRAWLAPALSYPPDEDAVPEPGTLESTLRTMRSFPFRARDVRVLIVLGDAPAEFDEDLRLLRPRDAHVTGFLRPALSTFDAPLSDQLAQRDYEVWDLWLIDTVSEPPPSWRWIGGAVGGGCALLLIGVVQFRWRRFRKTFVAGV